MRCAPKRLLVISQFYAEETGTGYSMTKNAEGLAKHFPIAVLCGQPNYVDNHKRAPRREYVNGVEIYRCRATPFTNKAILPKAINMLTISITIFSSALNTIKSGDAVLTVNLPFLLPFLAFWAARLRGAKCLLLIHDVYPEGLVVAGVIRSGSAIRRFLDWCFVRLYRSVNRIVVLGRDMQDLVARKLGCDPAEIFVIPNAADLEHIVPQPRGQNRLLVQLGITEKFVVKYAGHMGRTHGLECLIEAARILGNKTSEVHFLFVGSGPKKPWLERATVDYDLKNVTIIPYLPRNDVFDAVNACDVGVISLKQGMQGVSVPGRIYDLLAAGKPVILVGEQNSELSLVIQEEQVGWVVPPNEPFRIVEAITEAQSNPSLLREMGLRARLAAETKYSEEAKIESFRRVIEGLDCS